MKHEKGIVKVVSEYEVEKSTREGWVVESRFLKKVVLPFQETEVDPHIGKSNYYPIHGNTGVVNVQRMREVEQLVFVVRLDEDSAIARLTEELKASTASTQKYAAELGEQKKIAAEAETKAKALHEGYDNVSARLRAQSEAGEVMRKALKKLEEDLAKVRKAVGDIKFKEIVG